MSPPKGRPCFCLLPGIVAMLQRSLSQHNTLGHVGWESWGEILPSTCTIINHRSEVNQVGYYFMVASKVLWHPHNQFVRRETLKSLVQPCQYAEGYSLSMDYH